MPGENSSPSRWAEDWAIPIIAAVMWIAWVSPVLHLALNNPVMHPTRLIVPAWWLLALLLAPLAIHRARLPGRWAPVLYALLGILAIPATWSVVPGVPEAGIWTWLVEQGRALTDWSRGIPSGLVLALAAIVAWRRGIAGSTLRYDGLWAGFVIGSLALGGVMLLPAETLAGIPGIDMLASILAFVLAGLGALALMALTGTLATENLRSTARLGISRSWLAVVGSTVIAVLILGWAAGLILAPETVGQALGYLRPVLEIFYLALVGLGTLLAYALLWIIQPLLQSAYRGLKPLLERDALGELRRYLLEDLRIGEREPPPLGPVWEASWRPILLVAFTAAALWLIIRAWRGRPRQRLGGILETRESILSADLLRAQLAGLVRLHKPPEPFLPLDPDGSTRDAVRQVYQALLAGAREAGLARRRESTPGNYERALVERWPQHAPALGMLTRLYVLARYGPADPTPTDVSRAREALTDLPFERHAKEARN